MKTIKLVFDRQTLEQYTTQYFNEHPRAKKPPIRQPYHESINTWMIMRRPAMNALKGKWKTFIKWFIHEQGYDNLRIERCEMTFSVYYPNNKRHDPDNSTPKFILDGLVDSGFLTDDDSCHITKLSLQCFVDTEHPRTEILVKIME